jgi:hypothetical protein
MQVSPPLPIVIVGMTPDIVGMTHVIVGLLPRHRRAFAASSSGV